MHSPRPIEEQKKQLAESRWRRVGHIATFLSIGLLTPVAITSIYQIASGGVVSDISEGFYLNPTAMQVCAGLGLGLYLVIGIPCTNKANACTQEEKNKHHPYHNLGAPVILSCISIGISSYLLPNLIVDWEPRFSAATGFGIGFIIGAGYMLYKELTRKVSDISYDTSLKIPFPIALGGTCALSAGLAPIIANTISDQMGWSTTFAILISTALLHLFTEKAEFFTQGF